MTMDAGSIKYTVEAETSDLLMAEKAVDKSTSAIAQDFKKVDVAAKKTSTQMTKTAKGVRTGMASMGRGAGQAGIQFQQFIGQVQGGQGVMLALSQQSADLGIVLGAPLLGAVLGISASIAGMLLPSLFKAKEATEDLTKELRELATQQQLTANEAAILSEAEGRKMADSLIKVTALTKKLKEEEEKASRQRGAMNAFTDKSTDTYKRYEKGLEESLAEQNKLNVSIVVLNNQIEKSAANIVTYNNNIGDAAESTTETTKKSDGLTASLKGQIIALQEGEKAAFEYATMQTLGLTAVEKIPDAIQKQIDKVFELRDAQKQAAIDKRKLTADEAKKGSITDQGVSFSAGIISKGMSPADKMQEDMDRLVELRATDLENRALHEEAITSLESRASKLRIDQKLEEAEAVKKGQMMMTGAVLGFVAASTGALMQGMDEQSGSYKAMFAIQKAAAIASTIVNAHVASAAALSPVGGLGPVAGIPLSNTILGIGYASAGIIAGTAIAGGREFGGGVSKGNAYRMGEAGPEILTQGGKNYVIPGQNGSVTPNNQMGGGVSIVVNNNAPGVDVQASASQDGKTIEIAVKRAVSEVANQISNNQGQVPRALRQSTNTTMRANR